MREGWEYKKLGEVCTIKAGYTPQKNELSDNGAYPYYKVADMNTLGNDVYLDITSSYKIDANKLFPKGAIVFPKNGAAVSTNKKRILKYDSIVDLNTGVAIFPKSINEKFAYYWFIDTDFKKYVRGGALPTLDIKSLKDKTFPSIDKSIQLAIVSELDKINELIRLKKEQLKDFDNLAQSIFYEMFGDPVENEKGWEVETVQNSCTLKSGDSKANNSKVGTLPYIKVGDMNLPENENYINISTNYVDKETNIKRIFPIGTIIFPKRGGAILTNKKRLTNVEICCDLNIMGVTPGNMLNKYYLFQYFKILDLSTICSGSTVLQLNNCDINPLRIPLPPLSLQHLFAQRIEQIEHQKAEVQKAIADLETLLASRMQYWFE
jgi:putative type I restriction modification DNA specificity domain protein